MPRAPLAKCLHENHEFAKLRPDLIRPRSGLQTSEIKFVGTRHIIVEKLAKAHKNSKLHYYSAILKAVFISFNCILKHFKSAFDW